MPDPGLIVSLLEPEEATQYMRVRHETFRLDINKILYASADDYEPSQVTLDGVAEAIRNSIIKKEILYLKCVDTSTGEIIAGARWRYIRPTDPNAKERTREEVEEDLVLPEPYAESHSGMWKAFFDQFHDCRRDIMGTRPYYCLETLVTYPNHHRRGAGGLLVGWGCQKADEAGVEAYLEASQMGVPLYARYGFEPIKDISLDLKRWGGKEVIEWTLMRRPTKHATN